MLLLKTNGNLYENNLSIKVMFNFFILKRQCFETKLALYIFTVEHRFACSFQNYVNKLRFLDIACNFKKNYFKTTPCFY